MPSQPNHQHQPKPCIVVFLIVVIVVIIVVLLREAKVRETVFWRSSNADDGEFGDGCDEHFHVIEIFVSELMRLYTAHIAKLLNVVCEQGGSNWLEQCQPSPVPKFDSLDELMSDIGQLYDVMIMLLL